MIPSKDTVGKCEIIEVMIMGRYVIFIVVMYSFIFSCKSNAELLSGEVYRLYVDVDVFDDDGVKKIAPKNSKYTLVGTASDKSGYIIAFDKIYSPCDKNDDVCRSGYVDYGKAYFVTKEVKFFSEVSESLAKFELENVSKLSLTGLSSGPLVVPFKFRLNDDSFTGDAAIGLYAGITFEPGCTRANWCFRITPLVSAGISQVSVASGTETESKTAVTWAAGFLITDWADINIGVIYGEDRIGEKSWQYEGEGWVSIMVGWKI